MNRNGEFKLHDPSKEAKPMTLADQLNENGIFVCNSNNYRSTVDQHPSLVLFYAEWCPHCHRMAGPLSKVNEFVNQENRKRDKFKYRVVAVDSDKNSELAGNMRPPVSSYPTLFIYDKTGRNYIPYNGERSPQALWEALSRY